METLTKADVQHKALIVYVGKNWDGLGREKLYDAARFAWKTRLDRVRGAEIVIAVYKRHVAGVFVPRKWIKVPHSDRCEFIGEEASFGIQQFYVGKRLSDELKGVGGGFRYVHC